MIQRVTYLDSLFQVLSSSQVYKDMNMVRSKNDLHGHEYTAVTLGKTAKRGGGGAEDLLTYQEPLVFKSSLVSRESGGSSATIMQCTDMDHAANRSEATTHKQLKFLEL